jgi:hypothetical protein
MTVETLNLREAAIEVPSLANKASDSARDTETDTGLRGVLTNATALLVASTLTLPISLTAISERPDTLTSMSRVRSNVTVPVEESIAERYARMGSSAWFRATHENRSLGDVVGVE